MYNPTDSEKLKLLDQSILILIERLYQIHNNYLPWAFKDLKNDSGLIVIEEVLKELGILDDEGCINVTWLDTEINKICEVYT